MHQLINLNGFGLAFSVLQFATDEVPGENFNDIVHNNNLELV